MKTDPLPAADRVWDLPVRLVHGLFIACFAGAWLTAESERLRLLHVTLGLTMAGLAIFRIVWGFAGTRHARFADFVRAPGAVLRYLRSLLTGRPEHHAGHNPAGGWAVLALLGLILVTTASGWATYSDWGGEWLEEAHEVAAHALLLLAAVHVAGVLVSSVLHHENLLRPMFTTGRKPGATSGVKPVRAVAALVLAAVLGFWALQWQQPAVGTQTAAAPAGSHEDDDD